MPTEGRVDDRERVGALVQPPTADDEAALREPGDPATVRPNELARDVVQRLRQKGDHAPERLYVTTARGRLLGTVAVASLLALARADELPG